MTTSPEAQLEPPRAVSLGTAAARNLATTTKSAPQMQEITLPLAAADAALGAGPGRHLPGEPAAELRRRRRPGDVRARPAPRSGSSPRELGELPLLRDFERRGGADRARPTAAGSASSRAGEVLVAASGSPADEVYPASPTARSSRSAPGTYGDETPCSACSPTATYFGDQALLDRGRHRGSTPPRAADRGHACSTLSRADFEPSLPSAPAAARPPRSGALASRAQRSQQVRRGGDRARRPATRASPTCPAPSSTTRPSPREYELSVAQTVLRVHTRVADLYNQPMNQTEQQLRLTVEALRERQEHELINNREFGLLNNADYEQRIQPHAGAAHPGRPGRAAQPPPRLQVLPRPPAGHRGDRPRVQQARPLPGPRRHRRPPGPRLARGADPSRATRSRSPRPVRRSILSMRTGEDNQGVIGLQQTGMPGRVRAGPVRPLHGHRRAGDHLLPGHAPTTRPPSWCRTRSACWRTWRSPAGPGSGPGPQVPVPPPDPPSRPRVPDGSQDSRPPHQGVIDARARADTSAVEPARGRCPFRGACPR